AGTGSYELPAAGTITIGRSRDNTICVDDRSISRHHAVLSLNGGIYVEDLGSANGTRVRDVSAMGDEASATKPPREVVVESGQRVEVTAGCVVMVGSVLLAIKSTEVMTTVSEPVPLVVRDPALETVVALADRAAQGTLPVLILGETGVGKEVIAERIVF